MADIFISYARADRDHVEKLAAALEGEGYSVWWDRRIQSGAEFSKDIEAELDAAKAVVVCWSRRANQSRWVKDEANAGAETGKLLTITLDGELPPIGFRQFHCADLSGWRGDPAAAAFRDFNAAVKARVSGQAPAAPVSGLAKSTKKHGSSNAPIIVAIVAAAIIAIILIQRLTEDASDASDPAAKEGGVVQLAPQQTAPLEANTAPDETAVASDNTAAPIVAAASDNNIVAVLPFANRSARAEDAFFADGMHDDLLTKLSKISALQVISRTSVMRFRDTEQPIPEIAGALGAAVVMEGAVQRSGTRVRINVQLIDGITDQHLWAEIYDRELTAENIFDIQEEITRAIANALEAVLSGADEAALEARPTDNVAAYDAYLRGLARAPLLFTVSLADREGAIRAFDEAITLDPNFAAAHARKSREELSVYWLLAGGEAWREAAAGSLAKAQALAPNDSDTLLALAYFQYWGELDYDRADATFDKLLARTPNSADAISGKAFTQRRRGNFQAALDGLLRAAKLDPLDVGYQLEIVDTASHSNDWDAGEEALAHAKKIAPRNPGVAQYGYWFGLSSGDATRAAREIGRVVDNADARYYSLRVEEASLTRDRSKVEAALLAWPQSLRAPIFFPEFYDLSKAEAFVVLGAYKDANMLLAEIKASTERREIAYPGGWAGNAFVFPVTLPGLMGDLDAVTELVDAYEANRPNDVWANRNRDEVIAEAFANAGDADRALFHLERACDVMGEWCYRFYQINPAFDVLHDHPRWAAMRADYEKWTAAQEGAE